MCMGNLWRYGMERLAVYPYVLRVKQDGNLA